MVTSLKSKISVFTLGCSKNLVDSENLMGHLKYHGFNVSHESYNELNDIVLVNTCGFINDAKEESINTILELVEMKNAGRIKKIIVMGCLSQRYREQLKIEIPEVDQYFGVYQMPEILKYLKCDLQTQLVGERLISTPGHYAYLKISEGCDRKCSFCAIPFIKGKHKSLPENELIVEAEKLSLSGVKELILISQDLTYYGMDVNNQRSLPQLVQKLSEIKGIEWLRLHYAYPGGFPFELLNVIKENKNICRYLDIPLQHANNRILKSMRRGIDYRQTCELITTIREKVPGIAIRTSFIVGYPGETDEEFKELLNFIAEYRFERVGVFTYSHEEDTSAFILKNDIPEDEKNRRAEQLMMIQENISNIHNQEKVGKVFKVIIDSDEGDHYIGRTEFDSPEVDNEVVLKKTKFSGKLLAGNFYDIEIIGAASYEIEGVPILNKI